MITDIRQDITWGSSQCAEKLAGNRLIDWSFYALILVFLVIWNFLFGSWFKSQLGSLVSAVNGFYVSQFLGLSWTVWCLLQNDYYMDWFPSAPR
jgi:hypothetical protein